MKKISLTKKNALVLFGLFLSLAMLEAGLRIGGVAYQLLQDYRNRISLARRGTYRILCLGDSVTALGGRNSYPQQLEEILNQQEVGIKFSVLNKGIPGAKTGTILSQVQDNLDKYSPDMVIALMGINDGGETVAYKSGYAEKLVKSLRIFKLAGFLWESIVSNAATIGSHAPRENNIPGNDDVYIGLGCLLRDQGRFGEAEEALTRAIDINPERDGLYVELGWCYIDQGKYVDAEGILTRALEINPGNDEAYVGLGWCYWGRRDYEMAEMMYQKAIEISPEQKAIYIGLGWVYRYQKKYDKAVEMFERALRMDPDDDALCAILAALYQEQGKDASAHEYVRKTRRLRMETYNEVTRQNYQRLKEIVTTRGVKLVCVQYPMRNVGQLQKMLEPDDDVILVDNEVEFKKAVKQGSIDEYFMDMFGGDFGHCTPKGNRLLAKNIAEVILKQYFNK